MRRRFHSAFTCLITCALLLAASRAATCGELPRDFSIKYQGATGGFQQCYAHATVEGKVRREFPQEKKFVEQKYVYRAAGPKMRVDVTVLAQQEMGLEVDSNRAYIATPPGSLVAYQNAHSKVFNTAKEISYADCRARIENETPLLSPYRFDMKGTLLDHLRLPTVRVASLQNVKREGERLVKIIYDESVTDNSQTPAMKSYFLLAPDQGWAVPSSSASAAAAKARSSTAARSTTAANKTACRWSIASSSGKSTAPNANASATS